MRDVGIDAVCLPRCGVVQQNTVLHQPRGKNRKQSRFRGSSGKHEQSRKAEENLDQRSVVFDGVIIGGTAGCLESEGGRTIMVLAWKKRLIFAIPTRIALKLHSE